jgi:hypothetical protein
MIFMPWKCPSCGRQNYETFNNCSCGYSYSEAVLTKHGLSEYQDLSEEAGQLRDVALNCVSDCAVSLDEPAEPHVVQNPERSDSAGGVPHEEVIKEIDSWLFTFSDADNSVSISTPALKSFSLKLSLEDIEELLEFLYEKTGNEKTMRKIGIGATDVLGVIDKVDRMIEEKKSKVSIKFSSEELQDITEFINMQLKA